MNYLNKVTDKKNIYSDFLYLYAKDTAFINNSYSIIERFHDPNSILLKRREIAFDRMELSRKVISLKAANNKHLCAHSDLNDAIIANIDWVGTWETFQLVTFDNKECAILSYNGNLLCADLRQQNELFANRSRLGSWETFTLIKFENNFVAFKAANGKYLSVDEGSSRIYANSDKVSKMETFEMIEEK